MMNFETTMKRLSQKTIVSCADLPVSRTSVRECLIHGLKSVIQLRAGFQAFAYLIHRPNFFVIAHRR